VWSHAQSGDEAEFPERPDPAAVVNAVVVRELCLYNHALPPQLAFAITRLYG
jgi:hypothetical protein